MGQHWSKYKAKPTTIDGIRFASKKEGKRFEQLKMIQRAGVIHSLELQPRFPLKVNDILVTTYVADFRYVEAATGELVIEDVKGFRTREYTMKKKLLRALTGIEVRET